VLDLFKVTGNVFTILLRHTMSNLLITSGRANLQLAERIAQYISDYLGEPFALGKVTTKNFSDGEISVKYEENVRGTDLYIIQSTQAPADNIMELLMMIDAAKRASAKRITAVIPYFGYSRQDRKDQPRVSITAKLVANMITAAGADRVITMELHTPQLQGFFDIPLDHLYSARALKKAFEKLQLSNLVIVAPDVGSAKTARSYAKRLGADLAIIDKRRTAHNQSEVLNIIGDVKGKNAIIIDDLIDTAGTFCNCAEAVSDAGAESVYGACTHPVFSGSAVEKIEKSSLKKLFVTDTTVPSEPNKSAMEQSSKIEVCSVAEIIGEAILRTNNNLSISSLFDLPSM
jgi:ribose-phosphate pyrophosphokinase